MVKIKQNRSSFGKNSGSFQQKRKRDQKNEAVKIEE